MTCRQTVTVSCRDECAEELHKVPANRVSVEYDGRYEHGRKDLPSWLKCRPRRTIVSGLCPTSTALHEQEEERQGLESRKIAGEGRWKQFVVDHARTSLVEYSTSTPQYPPSFFTREEEEKMLRGDDEDDEDDDTPLAIPQKKVNTCSLDRDCNILEDSRYRLFDITVDLNDFAESRIYHDEYLTFLNNVDAAYKILHTRYTKRSLERGERYDDEKLRIFVHRIESSDALRYWSRTDRTVCHMGLRRGGFLVFVVWLLVEIQEPLEEPSRSPQPAADSNDDPEFSKKCKKGVTDLISRFKKPSPQSSSELLQSAEQTVTNNSQSTASSNPQTLQEQPSHFLREKKDKDYYRKYLDLEPDRRYDYPGVSFVPKMRPMKHIRRKLAKWKAVFRPPPVDVQSPVTAQ